MKKIGRLLAVAIAALIAVTCLTVPAAAGDALVSVWEYKIGISAPKTAVDFDEEFRVNVIIISGSAENYAFAQTTVTYDADKVSYVSYVPAEGLVVTKKSDGELLVSVSGDAKTIENNGSTIAELIFKAGQSEGTAGLGIKDPSAGPKGNEQICYTYPYGYLNDVTVGMSLDQESITVSTGEYVQLNATVASEDTANIVWSVEDQSIVKVDGSGKVQALGYGKTTVSAATKDGKYTAACSVQTRFNDVTEKDVADGSITQGEFDRTYWAADAGIIKGKTDSNGIMYFSRLTDTTRAQMAVMLYRYAKMVDKYAAAKALEKGKKAVRFTDLAGVSAGAVEGIYWAVGAGITVGYTESDGTVTFRPQNSISRASTIIMFYRMAEKPTVTAGSTGFSDVDGVLNQSTDTYKAIAWAKVNGITKGSEYPAGSGKYIFDRVSNIERRQMITFLYRYHTLEEATAKAENLSRAEAVLDLVNAEREKEGLSALTLSTELTELATMKSKDMAVNNYFSHESPTYGDPFDMLQTYGVTFLAAGENIAAGQPTPESVVTAWMNSEGHRANILNANYTEIGIGCYEGGSWRIYWTQLFIGK